MNKSLAFLIGCAIIGAILFILLWEFGGLRGKEIQPAFALMDYKVSSSDGNVINLIIFNSAGTKVTLNSVDVTITHKKCSYAVNSDLRAGESLSIAIPKSGDCASIILPNKGDYYKADITFNYTNIASNRTHTSIGECHGTVE